MIPMFDPLYLMLMAPALILALVAQFFTKATFKKYSQVGSARGMTGAEAAHYMLEQRGVNNVEIEQVQGFLSDHYDPRSRTLRLSPDVFNGRSLSAIGVACHEAGHALQHASGYAMLSLRSALVPITSFSSSFSYVIIMAGFFMNAPKLVGIGALLFVGAVVFSLVTLPVEWDASARAKVAMVESGIVLASEAKYSGRVLNAAFLTYVASAVSALVTLLYYLMRAGLLGGNQRD